MHIEESEVDDHGGQGRVEKSSPDLDRQKAASDEPERTTVCNATETFVNHFTDAIDLDDTLSDIDDDEVAFLTSLLV